MEVLSMDMMGKLDILGHYCNALCMDRVKVGIFQEASQIVLCIFLQSYDMQLEAQVILPYFLGNFTDQMQKGHFHMRSSVLFWNWQISEGKCPWPVLSEPLKWVSLHELLVSGLASHIGWSFLLADSEGPASTTICASCLIGDYPVIVPPLPVSSSPPSSYPSHLG